MGSLDKSRKASLLERFFGVFNGWSQRSFNKANTSIDVMTSCSPENAEVVLVLIRSLSLAHSNAFVNFWFFHSSVPESKIEEIRAFCVRLPNIRFNSVKIEDVSLFEEMRNIGGKPDHERFLWFSAHEYLPDTLDRVIYLDALDTIVLEDLSGFFNVDFDGRVVAACRELNHYSKLPLIEVSPAMNFFAETGDRDTVIRMSFGLFNSGSIVINLQKLREFAPSLKKYCEIGRWAKEELGANFGDQGLFSLVHGSDFKLVDEKFNYRFFAHGPRTLIKKPAVIHYCGFAMKPFKIAFSKADEKRIRNYISKRKAGPIRIGSFYRLDSHYIPYYRLWWTFCRGIPVYKRLLHDARNLATEKVMKQVRKDAVEGS